LPDLIWNAAALEGNNFTLSEVRTLLDGTTVGGKNIDDVKQIFALGDAYSRLDELVGTAAFSLSKSGSDELHELVAVHEAFEGKDRQLVEETYICPVVDLPQELRTAMAVRCF
jgi:hypothetical protein